MERSGFAAICALATVTVGVACTSTSGLVGGESEGDGGEGTREVTTFSARDAEADSSSVTAANPCAADTATDPRNCGRCGHDCLGGACEVGRCRPVVLASAAGKNEAGPLIDRTHVYWVTGTAAPKTFTMLR